MNGQVTVTVKGSNVVVVPEDVERILRALDVYYDTTRSTKVKELVTLFEQVVERPLTRRPHPYQPNDLGTDGCSICGKAQAWKLHE